MLIGVSTEPIALGPLGLIWREQTIVASLSHVIDDFAAALDLLASGAVQVSGLLTDEVPLGDIQTGLHSLRDAPADHLKIVAVPTPQPARHRQEDP